MWLNCPYSCTWKDENLKLARDVKNTILFFKLPFEWCFQVETLTAVWDNCIPKNNFRGKMFRMIKGQKARNKKIRKEKKKKRWIGMSGKYVQSSSIYLALGSGCCHSKRRNLSQLSSRTVNKLNLSATRNINIEFLFC